MTQDDIDSIVLSVVEGTKEENRVVFRSHIEASSEVLRTSLLAEVDRYLNWKVFEEGKGVVICNDMQGVVQKIIEGLKTMTEDWGTV